MPVPILAPRVLLHFEGAAVAAAAVTLYFVDGGRWPLLLLLALAPDVSMVAYVAGPRWGSLAYNAVHTYLGPIGLYAAAALAGLALWTHVALVWAAHIGGDRLFGFGLKYATDFGDTHFDRV